MKHRFALLSALSLFATGIALAEQEDRTSRLSETTFHPDALALEDPYQWLEEVEGERALNWAKAQNAVTTDELKADPRFDLLRQRLLAILDSRERIPHVSKIGEHLYNFWRDEKNVRGLWRRTTLEEYRKAEPAWEVVLDLDALAEREEENWVWKGSSTLYPDRDRALLFLSRGGADAAVVREFDLAAKEFVPDGFFLPEAKSRVTWRNRDALHVGTDFGPGSLTDSGYPRVIKEWRRGTPLAAAHTVLVGDSRDVSLAASVIHDRGRTYEFLTRSMTFFTHQTFLRRGKDWVKIEKPDDARVRTFQDWLLLTLRSDWHINDHIHPTGSLLAIRFDDFLEGKRDFSVLFTPTSRKSLASINGTRNYLILNELENVRPQLHLLRPDENGAWDRTRLEAPDFGSISAWGLDPDESDDYFLSVSDFLTPSSLYLGSVGEGNREPLRALPEFFHAPGYTIDQFEATSKDGARIPYFQVSHKDLSHDGTNPTLLYGYGGFEISMTPSYNASVGAAWLEKGGVYVLANIRGGGEFGPAWHQAARKENRQRAYDDFIAVAEDLIRRGVTSPEHLGISGGSNGGLLVGVMLTQRPDLFKAVVCAVPLLDMRRYNQLLAGASWMGEYGNPDIPEEWEFLRAYSPYHNLSQERKYPRVLFTTSTRDDRVHPGHARKMAAKMREWGHDILYYENMEGGHGGAANNQQRAFISALAYTFLWNELK